MKLFEYYIGNNIKLHAWIQHHTTNLSFYSSSRVYISGRYIDIPTYCWDYHLAQLEDEQLTSEDWFWTE